MLGQMWKCISNYFYFHGKKTEVAQCFFNMQDSWGDADPSGKPLIWSDFSWLEWDQANQRPLRKKEPWVGFSSDESEKLPMGGGTRCYQPAVKESDWFILDVTDREFVRSPFKVFFFIIIII